MPDIVLATLNARFAHSAFGLRYLMTNLGALRDRAVVLEFDINQRPLDILEAILAQSPRIVGLGLYVWNIAQSTQLAADLKRLRPDITLILGGPEISHETDEQPIAQLADYVIAGEADIALTELCSRILAGRGPSTRLIAAPPPDVGRLQLPYDLCTDADIAHRVIYVEASRGCPFHCDFCLSALDVPVRAFPLDTFLPAMRRLLDRGATQFKFVDRTFNLNINTARAILQFFLDRYRPGLFLHFEMIPDHLPEALREIIRKFPPGSLQFEVGIQTFSPAVAALINRRQDNEKAEENLRFLRNESSVHIHADLIAGLPGEDLASFAAGFDRLYALRPQEIQVGILKRLRGAPIARHTAEWKMLYSQEPPYEVLQTSLIDFATMQRLRRFARYWEMVVNSGNFIETAGLLLGQQQPSPFWSFWAFCEHLHERLGRAHGIALDNLAGLLFEYLIKQGHKPFQIAAALWSDYQRCGRSDVPAFLRAHLPNVESSRGSPRQRRTRQSRHLPS